MKANHIPRYIRLINRVRGLNSRSDNCWQQGNYCPHCKYCGITNIQMSIDGDHFKHCKMSGIAKQIKYWNKAITEENTARKARKTASLAIFDPKEVKP